MMRGVLLTALVLGACPAGWCQTSAAGTAPGSAAQTPSPAEAPPPAPGAVPEPEPPPPAPPAPPSGGDSGLGADIKAYYTAPLHWNGGQWAWFGGALLAIGASHHYDSEVRAHFAKNVPPGTSSSSYDVQDAIPTAVVLTATWGFAVLIDDYDGHREAWNMLEAAGLSSVTAYALKFAVGREGPDQTDNPNEWGKGGSGTFPSWHSTAAFAVGTVLAESGNDEYRWIRRLLGYGLGAATSYERLKHNAHWLSDTVAGAALGIASAHFVMNRHAQQQEPNGLAVEPVPGGVMLAYRLTLP
jgi:membrane-associated phospholipid phosphatase